MNDDFYLSLDEARSELHRRWNEPGLRQRVESALGERVIPTFLHGPRAVRFQQVNSPDNGFMSFFYRAAYVGAEPLTIEYLGDRFTHLNEEKKNLTRLRASVGTERFIVKVLDLNPWEGMALQEVVIPGGEKLVDFHHGLFDIALIHANSDDMTQWFHSTGKSSEYYFFLFAHCIAHSVWFETFLDEDETEDRRRRKGECWFTNNVVRPNFERVGQEFGLRPMIVRSYPPDQTDDEDFFWWSYPPRVNDYIVDYARRHGLALRPVR